MFWATASDDSKGEQNAIERPTNQPSSNGARVVGSQAFLDDRPVLGGLTENRSGPAALHIRLHHLNIVDEAPLFIPGAVGQVSRTEPTEKFLPRQQSTDAGRGLFHSLSREIWKKHPLDVNCYARAIRLDSVRNTEQERGDLAMLDVIGRQDLIHAAVVVSRRPGAR